MAVGRGLSWCRHTPSMPDVFHRRLDKLCNDMAALDVPCAYAGGTTQQLQLPCGSVVHVTAAGRTSKLVGWDADGSVFETFHVPVKERGLAGERKAVVTIATQFPGDNTKPRTAGAFRASVRLIGAPPAPPTGLTVGGRDTGTTTLLWEPPHPYADVNPGEVTYELWVKPLTTGQYASKDFAGATGSLVTTGSSPASARSTPRTPSTGPPISEFRLEWTGPSCVAHIPNTFQAGLVRVVARNQAGASAPSEYVTVHPSRQVRRVRRSDSAQVLTANGAAAAARHKPSPRPQRRRRGRGASVLSTVGGGSGGGSSVLTATMGSTASDGGVVGAEAVAAIDAVATMLRRQSVAVPKAATVLDTAYMQSPKARPRRTPKPANTETSPPIHETDERKGDSDVAAAPERQPPLSSMAPSPGGSQTSRESDPAHGVHSKAQAQATPSKRAQRGRQRSRRPIGLQLPGTRASDRSTSPSPGNQKPRAKSTRHQPLRRVASERVYRRPTASHSLGGRVTRAPGNRTGGGAARDVLGDLTALASLDVVTLESPQMCRRKRFSFSAASVARHGGASEQHMTNGTVARVRRSAAAEAALSTISPLPGRSPGRSPARSTSRSPVPSPGRSPARLLGAGSPLPSPARLVKLGADGGGAVDAGEEASQQWKGPVLVGSGDVASGMSGRHAKRGASVRFTPAQQRRVDAAAKLLVGLATDGHIVSLFGCTGPTLLRGLAVAHSCDKFAAVPILFVLLEAMACLGVRAEQAQCHQFNARLLVSSMQRAVSAAVPIFAQHYVLTQPTYTALLHQALDVNGLLTSFMTPGWLGQGLRSRAVLREFEAHTSKLAATFGRCRLSPILHISFNLRAHRHYVHEKVVLSGALRYASAAVRALLNGDVGATTSSHVAPVSIRSGGSVHTDATPADRRFTVAVARELAQIMEVPPHHASRLAEELLLLRAKAAFDLATTTAADAEPEPSSVSRSPGAMSAGAAVATAQVARLQVRPTFSDSSRHLLGMVRDKKASPPPRVAHDDSIRQAQPAPLVTGPGAISLPAMAVHVGHVY